MRRFVVPIPTDWPNRELCTVSGKIAFHSPAAAERVRRLIRRRRGHSLTVYRCWRCRWWHLGHALVERSRKGKRVKVRMRT